MKHVHPCGASILALMLSAGAALAVTPEEVWANWQASMTASGSTVTGTATRNGDTLEATNVSVTILNPDGQGTIATTFDRVTFRDLGDGTVEVTLPTTFPFTLTDMPDAPGSFTATLDEKGLSIIASGTAEATSYAIAAEEYALTFSDFTEKDGTTPVDLSAKVVVSGLAATYAVTPGDGITGLDSSATATATTFEIAAKDPDQGFDGSLSVNIGPIEASTKGALVGQELMANLSEALKAGFFIDSTTSVGPMTITGSYADRVSTGTIDATLSGISTRVALDPARLDYGFGFTGADIKVSGSDIPLPEVQTAFGELSFAFAFPVAPSDAPQDFSAAIRLVDLTAADMLWSMVDPGGQLKRDPMTFIFDVKGTGRLLGNIMDPEVQASGNPPAELLSLDLSEVLFKALGGQIDATGGLTFDNSDLVTFGGFPAPTGKATVNLKGINALIDTAVSMGFVPESEVMAARMGLAMFARPGAGPDELISEIEFKDKGMFVNGQQLR